MSLSKPDIPWETEVCTSVCCGQNLRELMKEREHNWNNYNKTIVELKLTDDFISSKNKESELAKENFATFEKKFLDEKLKCSNILRNIEDSLKDFMKATETMSEINKVYMEARINSATIWSDIVVLREKSLEESRRCSATLSKIAELSKIINDEEIRKRDEDASAVKLAVTKLLEFNTLRNDDIITIKTQSRNIEDNNEVEEKITETNNDVIKLSSSDEADDNEEVGDVEKSNDVDVDDDDDEVADEYEVEKSEHPKFNALIERSKITKRDCEHLKNNSLFHSSKKIKGLGFSQYHASSYK